MAGVFVIAEAGVNHNGCLKTAIKLIDAAKYAGASAVKFQCFKADTLATPFAEKAGYQKKTTGNQESQFDMLKRLELNFDSHLILDNYASGLGIMFLSSPFDFDSVSLLEKINMPIYKIPSGEIVNIPLLRKIGALNKKVILSTGMSNLGEIEFAINVLIEAGCDRQNISLLQCNTEYPTPYIDVNLRVMQTLKNCFCLDVGYSDHTLGIEIPIAAVALGAKIIEKHLTLDTSMDGPDHLASLNPEQFKLMVAGINNVVISLGSMIKEPSDSELKNLKIVRKSIVASKDISVGDTFSLDNLMLKRPGTGLSSMLWDNIVGRRASREFKENEFVSF
jgi:N,N'-diacetyllegionaminate synthase